MTLDFCSASLMNPHWGEQIRFRPDNVLKVSMVFQGLDRSGAQAVWKPFLDALDADKEWKVEFSPLKIVATSARTFWSPTLVKRVLGFIKKDDRPGVPETNVFWPGDQGQAGPVHARLRLGLAAGVAAGAGPAERARRYALRREPPPQPVAAPQQGARRRVARGRGRGPGHGRQPGRARRLRAPDHGRGGRAGLSGRGRPRARRRCRPAARPRRSAGRWKRSGSSCPRPAAYVSESNYFEPRWQEAFWGANYARLLAVKERYDPEGLFFMHHGPGSERWSADGFTRSA